MEFKHNFCESRLSDNTGPEMLNSVSSFFISLIPLIYGFPKDSLLFNFSILFIIQGISSFVYHFYLNWFGKHFDENCMILMMYLGIYNLIKLYFGDGNKNINLFSTINNVYFVLFISLNALPYLDFYFPIIFGIYVKFALYFLVLTMFKYEVKYQKWIIPLLISAFGASCWIVSEIHCNNYTKYGHVIWHILFPIGFYKIILLIDSLLISIKYSY